MQVDYCTIVKLGSETELEEGEAQVKLSRMLPLLQVDNFMSK